MRPRYPLEPLSAVRQLQVDAHERDVATQALKVRHAAQARADKEVSLAEERARAERTRASERGQLEAGQARVVDLARSADFELGAEQREAERKRELCAARRDELAAEKAEREARVELARAQAQKSALGRHRQRFDQAVARVTEREAEDDALELYHHDARGRS
ncbi:MAG TPA: hypothetical protein VI197_18685 [Polyangiaceae bacterium]